MRSEYQNLTEATDEALRKIAAVIRKSDKTLKKYLAEHICRMYQAAFDISRNAVSRNTGE